MAENLTAFTKQKEYLICVDSDGCAMDTMDIKHIHCFGPCMVKEWSLEKWADEILARWNEINLYSLTRGINRFKGLALALSEINELYCEIDDIDTLVNWVETSDELSNAALTRALGKNENSVSLKKALSWSTAVNESINGLPDSEKKPFPLVGEALSFAHRIADIAIVSSANYDAVIEEWERCGILQHTDIVLSQNAGSKAFCIGELLKKGYKKENVVMCGDAPGDKAAAEKNGVYFYPILVRREGASWQEFMDTALDRLMGGTYGGVYQSQKTKEFITNLGGEK